MNYFLKDMVRPFFKLFSTPNLLTFYRLSHQLIDRNPHRKKVARFNGLNFAFSDPQSLVFQYKDIFVDQIYRFEVGKMPHIIDCGANIGMSIAFFKKNFPDCKIWAFEPDPKIFQLLISNLESNNLSENVFLFQKAAWINESGVPFQSNGSDGGRIHENSPIFVKSIRLKNILSELTKIDFLKVDIEGAETTVLHDCRSELGKIKYIFVEFHSFISQRQKLSPIIHLLENAGFSCYLEPVHSISQPMFDSKVNNNSIQLNVFAINQNGE